MPLETARVELFRALNHLISIGMLIYPVDAHVSNALLQSSSDPFAINNASALVEITGQTGGRAFFTSDGLAQAIEHVPLQAKCRYILDFYSSVAPDNKFHRVHIQARRPGLRLKYKPGYWALRSEADISVGSRLQFALESPLVAEAIQLQANPAVSGQQMEISVYVDPQNIALKRKDRTWGATLDLAFGQKDESGRVFAVPPYRVLLSLGESAVASHEWLMTRAKVAIRAQTRSVRVVVHDETSRNTGSLDVPVEAAMSGRQ